MRITTDGYSLLAINHVKKRKIEEIEEHYIRYCKNLYESQSILTRWVKHFKFHPSLRFFHVGEYFAKGVALEKLKEDRRAWHNFWGFENEMKFISGVKSNTIVHLNSYESETVMELAKYLEIQINTYES